MTLDEKISALSGDRPALRGTLEMARRYNATPIVAGAIPRLGLPGVRFTDGPRGVVINHSTAFPSAMARGATFHPGLEARVGDAIGVEARTQGANLFAGVCINLLRHPAWGRAQETYGEDSYLLGEMGAAMIRGSQRHVMACVKHFAANSMENSRFWVDVQACEDDLRDVYLPHFRRCVDEGVASFMTAYNKVNGSFCGHHHRLITEILKDEWGFGGFVMSDFTFGVRDARALSAGLDLEMPFCWRFRKARRLVHDGVISTARLDDAVVRLVRQQVRFAQRGEPDRYRREVVAGSAHRALAREVATASVVLLRNKPRSWPDGGAAPVLPLDPTRARTVAVIGRLAAVPNIGDLGSSRVYPPEVVTILDGMTHAARGMGVGVSYCDGRHADRAAALAAESDVAVIVVGSTHRDEGEWIGKAGGDRKRLTLRARDEALIEAVASANLRTVVVLMGGSAFVTDRWRRRVAAMTMVWYPGMEGGHAVADVLFGLAPPGGRLPCTWPTAANRLPEFRRFTRRIRYGPLHGYRLMEAEQQEPAFPFGFGLGYTTITWSTPRVLAVTESTDGHRRVSVTVELRNAGARSGVEVVQVYVPEVLGTHPHALRTLRAFRRVALSSGAEATVELDVPVHRTTDRVFVGSSSAIRDLRVLDLA